MSATNPEPGDWFNIQYGTGRHDVYVVRVIDGLVTWTMPTWCPQSTETDPVDIFLKHRYYPDGVGTIYLGKGKRSILSRIFGWLDLLPLYRRPRKNR